MNATATDGCQLDEPVPAGYLGSGTRRTAGGIVLAVPAIALARWSLALAERDQPPGTDDSTPRCTAPKSSTVLVELCYNAARMPSVNNGHALIAHGPNARSVSATQAASASGSTHMKVPDWPK